MLLRMGRRPRRPPLGQARPCPCRLHPPPHGDHGPAHPGRLKPVQGGGPEQLRCDGARIRPDRTRLGELRAAPAPRRLPQHRRGGDTERHRAPRSQLRRCARHSRPSKMGKPIGDRRNSYGAASTASNGVWSIMKAEARSPGLIFLPSKGPRPSAPRNPPCAACTGPISGHGLLMRNLRWASRWATIVLRSGGRS